MGAPAVNAMNRAPMFPKVAYSVTQLGALSKGGTTYPGGLDLTTPSLALHPGALRDVLNYECALNGGYTRIAGYERVDGQAAPSSASYIIGQVDAFTTVPAVGARIRQTTTGATGYVAAVYNQVDAKYMVVTKVTGTFEVGDTIYVETGNPLTVTTSLTVTGTLQVPTLEVVGTAVETSVSISALQSAQYTAAAADIYRTAIGPVPGSGAVLGVCAITFDTTDQVFAFRADPTGTYVRVFKTSTSGWVEVPLHCTVAFTAGNGVEPTEGEMLSQGTVAATVKRVVWQSGSWAGTAAGIMVVTSPSGGQFTAGTATTPSGSTVTLGGAASQIVLLPGGHFEFAKANFSGQRTTQRIYGCDGVNDAFEFDGTILAPIPIGVTPTHIAAHRNHLFLSYGSSLAFSGDGEPYKFLSVDGGGEMALGDTVNAMLTLPGNQTSPALGVWMHQNTSVIYGTGQGTFQAVPFNAGGGGRPFSAQNLFDAFVMDSLGVVTFQTTFNFGNFQSSTLTRNIMPFIERERVRQIASTISRNKGQYRLFFSDGYGLWMTFANQTYLGATTVLFPNPVFCCDEDTNWDGEEVAYFGSSDGQGYVYQLDKGTSFDGAAIDAYITPAWDALKSPRVRKRFRAASIEVQSDGYATFSYGYQLGYGTPTITQPTPQSYTSSFTPPPLWDSFVWDNFIWDGRTLAPTDVDMVGTAENVQVTIRSTSAILPPFTINSLIYHWSPRRGIRV